MVSKTVNQQGATSDVRAGGTARRDVAPVDGDPRAVLRDAFGLSDFRDGQLAVIERLLAGRNVAAVFPTGGGKSLCYQLPSQMLEGTTIVVSPLIALMKDQCDALAQRGIAAARLDSSLSPSEYHGAMKDVREGRIKLLFASPERFFNERFLVSLSNLRVSLFAIDESHCISQWGHNFRPDYLKLADLTRRLDAERVLALTATATPEVLSDIREAFAIEAGDAIRTRFHRPNLHLRSSLQTADGQYPTLVQRLRERPQGSALIYVSLQKTAEEVAERLTADRVPATAYHAGMDSEQRMRIQQDFIAGRIERVVATIAFGMGIDKSDLRYVYHYNPPKSLEAYAQEIGRAGRDGNPATCEFLLVPEDRVVLENFVYGDTPSRQSVGRLVDLLAGQPDEFYVSHYKLSAECDIRILVVRTLLTYLELDGHLQSTGSRYDSYQVHPLVSSQTILGHFTGERREFVSGLLSSLTKGRKWFVLNVAVATKRLGDDRQRIIRAIDYFVERGWVEVKVADLVHGFRWRKRFADPKTTGDDLFERLSRREAGELARLDDVYDLATGDRCFATALAERFGESIGQPCGECSVCRGESLGPLPKTPPRPLGHSARSSLAQVMRKYPDHFTSLRDQARFLCGLSSPGFVRARLTRDASFGVCGHLPFAEVIAQLKQDA